MHNGIKPPSLSDMFTQAAGARLWPARLDSTQTARVLGFQDHDIPVLVSNDLLEPLGKPAANVRKYFAAVGLDMTQRSSARALPSSGRAAGVCPAIGRCG